MQAVHLASREVGDLLLLIGPLEIEHRDVGARGNLPLSHHDPVLAARDLLEDGARGDRAVAILIHVGEGDRVADREPTGVGPVVL